MPQAHLRRCRLASRLLPSLILCRRSRLGSCDACLHLGRSLHSSSQLDRV